jgi:hypothetical protein
VTAPVVVWPYAARVVRHYLISLLDSDIRVATEVPATRPAKLVTVTTASTSGGTNRALSRRWVIIQCYNAAETAAADLAEVVFSHMMAARDTPGNGIRDVVPVGTPARFDDPDDSTPRFQMTLEILLRATPVTP